MVLALNPIISMKIETKKAKKKNRNNKAQTIPLITNDASFQFFFGGGFV